MKTIADLNALIPTLCNLVKNNDHALGSTYYGGCEDDYECEYSSNSVSYEEDGWQIEILYKCAGDWDCDHGDYWTPSSCELNSAWGEVTEIFASHYDDDTEEETVFSEKDLIDLWRALDSVLENL